jgi:hypothetical protein
MLQLLSCFCLCFLLTPAKLIVLRLGDVYGERVALDEFKYHQLESQ